MIKANVCVARARFLLPRLRSRSAAERHPCWASVVATAAALPALGIVLPAWEPEWTQRAAAVLPAVAGSLGLWTPAAGGDVVVRATSLEPATWIVNTAAAVGSPECWRRAESSGRSSCGSLVRARRPSALPILECVVCLSRRRAPWDWSANRSCCAVRGWRSPLLGARAVPTCFCQWPPRPGATSASSRCSFTRWRTYVAGTGRSIHVPSRLRHQAAVIAAVTRIEGRAPDRCALPRAVAPAWPPEWRRTRSQRRRQKGGRRIRGLEPTR